MLELKNITAGYGAAAVLHDISINVTDKQVAALVGSNGAGKTTLVKVIMGLLKPTSGSILYDGKDITALPGHKRAELGIVPIMEGRRLFGKMTVRENLLVGATNSRAKPGRAATEEMVYAAFPVLKDRQSQLAKTLSGGEQQMLAIGRALMAQPQVLIIDEPSLGLSPKIVKEVFESIRMLNCEQGITMLLIEQNVILSLNICSMAYVIENGKVTLSGQADEILKNEHVKKAYLGI